MNKSKLRKLIREELLKEVDHYTVSEKIVSKFKGKFGDDWEEIKTLAKQLENIPLAKTYKLSSHVKNAEKGLHGIYRAVYKIGTDGGF